MPRYADDAKEQVRDAVDFADLVGSKIELQRSGVNQLKGLCPFHDERTPSFGINPVDKVYYCFGCGEGGDLFDFVMKTEGLDFKTTLEMLAERYGVTLEVLDEDPRAAERRKRRERLLELLERTTQYYERYLWESGEAAPARAYLAERGLGEEVLRTYRVGYAPSAWDKVLLVTRRAGFSVEELHAAGLVIKSEKSKGRVYDRFRRRIIFPLSDMRGKVVGFGARAMAGDEKGGAKYINSPESDIFHKGRMVYGAHLARAAAAKVATVIVTEGYTDVIALHQAGLANAICIMGTSMTEDQVGQLVRLAPRAVLALDADNAGQEAMLRAARVAEGRKLELRVATLPPGRDPAELVQQEGPEAVTDLVTGSLPFVRFRIDRILDQGDVDDPEGKDRIVAEVRPILSTMPPSVLREDLAGRVAERLRLSSTIAAMLVVPDPEAVAAASASASAAAGVAAVPVVAGLEPEFVPGGPGGGAPAGPSPVPEWEPEDTRWEEEDDEWGPEPEDLTPLPPPRMEREERMERTFLTLCLALPAEGAELLAKLDPDTHLTSPLMRRVAIHLRAHPAAPTEGLPEDDPVLTGLVRQLAVQAGRASSTRAALQVEWLQLEMGRVERAIAEARVAGEGNVGELAAARGRLRTELEDAMVRAIESDTG